MEEGSRDVTSSHWVGWLVY